MWVYKQGARYLLPPRKRKSQEKMRHTEGDSVTAQDFKAKDLRMGATNAQAPYRYGQKVKRPLQEPESP